MNRIIVIFSILCLNANLPCGSAQLSGTVTDDQSLRIHRGEAQSTIQQGGLVQTQQFANVATPAPQRQQGYLDKPAHNPPRNGNAFTSPPPFSGTSYQPPIAPPIQQSYRLPPRHPPYAIDVCAPGRADVLAARLAIGLVGSMVKHHHHHHHHNQLEATSKDNQMHLQMQTKSGY